MTDSDCSNCPRCVVDRVEPVLRAANVQVCGVKAKRTFLGGDLYSFGLREDTPLAEEPSKALTEMAMAHISAVSCDVRTPMFKRGHSFTAEDDHYVLTIEITSRSRDTTYYKICYHVKTPATAG